MYFYHNFFIFRFCFSILKIKISKKNGTIMAIWGVPLFYEGRLKYGIWNEFRENIDFKYRTPKINWLILTGNETKIRNNLTENMQIEEFVTKF